MKRVLLVGVTSFLLVAFGTAAQAGPVTFFGQDTGLGENTRLATHPNADAARLSFLANLVGVGTENFEGFSNGAGAPLPLTFPGSGGSITATLNGGGNVATISTGTNGVGRYPISGNNYWETGDVFSIAFSSPISAFGFYGVDIGDFGGQVTLTLVDGGTTTLTIPNAVNGPGGSVLYFGFYDTGNQYTGITFGNTAAGVDYFGFDDMTIGDLEQVVPTVPDPGATLLLFGMGIAGLTAFRRWRG